MSQLTTMRLGGAARYCTTVFNRQQLVEATEFAQNLGLDLLVLGEGSNLIVRDKGFSGLVIINRIKGFEILDDGLTLRVGAGEIWDTVVDRSVSMNLSGIEALSAIPGTTGATPVQNVGAYGQEIAQTLTELEVYDLQKKQFITMSNAACRFGYRTSRFKSVSKLRYVITSITLHLNKGHLRPPFYPRLQEYLDEHKISEYSPKNIRSAVVAIRSKILPDPKKFANAGSFFKNPLVTEEDANALLATYPDAPHWPMPDGQVKLAAGWLVEKAGLKDFRAYGMATHKYNALVFVNKSASSYADLQAFQRLVTDKIQAKFSIALEQEPELL